VKAVPGVLFVVAVFAAGVLVGRYAGPVGTEKSTSGTTTATEPALIGGTDTGWPADPLRVYYAGSYPRSGVHKRGSVFGSGFFDPTLDPELYRGLMESNLPQHEIDRLLRDAVVQYEDIESALNQPEVSPGQAEHDVRTALASSGFSAAEIDLQIESLFSSPTYEETDPSLTLPF
jgi:hypothetical protein